MKKRLLILLGLAVFVFEYQFIITPLDRKTKATESLIHKKENDYKTLQIILEKYRASTPKTETKKEKIAGKKFSLFSFTGKIVEKNSLISNVKSIKPLPVEKKNHFQIEKIKLNIENIPLEKLLKFLSDIENSNYPIYISEFSMVRNKTNPSLLKVAIEIITIKND